MSIPRAKRNITYPDIEDIELQAKYQKRKTLIMDLINVPITILESHIGTSKFPEVNQAGEVVKDAKGDPVYGEYAVVKCKRQGSEDILSFSTASKPIISQLRKANQHFMLNKIPKEYQGFNGIIKREGRKLKIFTSKNAMLKPLIEHSDTFKILEESGSPITKADCKYESCVDDETRKHMVEDDNELTMLLGDPLDPANDTTSNAYKRKHLNK